MGNTNPFSYSDYNPTYENTNTPKTGVRTSQFDISYSASSRPDPVRMNDGA